MAYKFLRSMTRVAACAALLASAAPPVLAQTATDQQIFPRGLAGSYLAGRAATYDGDFSAIAEYYTKALARDPSNVALMENVVFAQLALGNLQRAAPVAKQMWDQGSVSQIANIAMVGSLAQDGDFQSILDRDPETQMIADLADGLLEGWAALAVGDVTRAMSVFTEMAKEERLSFFADFHRALALASVGDYQSAEALFAKDNARLARATRRAALAYVEVLSQLDRNQDALEFMEKGFGVRLDPGLITIADRLKAGETLPFAIAATPLDGVAEVFYTIGIGLGRDANPDYALMYTRMATSLRPAHVDAALLSAELLDTLGRFDLAVAAYRAVPKDHPEFFAAELGRAEAMRRADNIETAAEVLSNLAKTYPEDPSVFAELGDVMSQRDDYAAAAEAYDAALALTEEDARGRWRLLYLRGISHERLKQWDQAESDFRAALALNPNQPQVLNYLGYSLVEKQIKLDEALSMIERAVAVEPESGYIVDSLGWVLYRLGRYEEAVGHMETAAALMPVDPVVNDHLGDVYWAVGREREAEFQWRRALSFVDPEDANSEADPERIRRKLDVGLDLVLEEEGAAPLQVANDG